MSILITQQQEHTPCYLQSEREGQAEAYKMLTEAARQRGKHLTVTEIRNLYSERFQSRRGTLDACAQVSEGFVGWCAGFIGVCLDEERNAPDPDGLWSPWHVTSVPLGTTVLLLDSPEFVRGMEWGLEHCFSTSVSRHTISTQELAHLLIETMIEEGQEEESVFDEFRAGFSFRWIMGRLHPKLKEMNKSLS